MQSSTTVRNSYLSGLSTTQGSGGTLDFRTGASPGVGNSASGTLLSTQTSVTLGSPSSGSMSLATTADSSAAATGTPGHARMKTSGGTATNDFTAGVGTAATLGTVTLSGGGVSAVAVSSGGTGYPANTPYFVTFTGGGGSGASGYCLATAGVLGAPTIIQAGSGYSGTVTATVTAPFDFTFSGTISLGGTVTLSGSPAFTAGNA